jgi:phosphonate dehydrogenase
MTLPRIVVGHRAFPETLSRLKTVADVVVPLPGADAMPVAELEFELTRADAWMAFMPDSADDALLARAPRLRIIGGALKGCDNFDVAACTRRGVWLSVVPDLLTVPTAELTIALMIGLARRVMEGDRHVRSGAFQGWRPQLYGIGLAGARVGFLGMGVIGQAVARRLQPFGVRQRYFDPRPLAASDERALDLTREHDLVDLLHWSQFLILAAPLTPDTLHIINRQTLSRLRPGCLLVNPSRGSLVDEHAVLAALESGRLAGYAADVFEMEDWARTDRPREIAAGLRSHPATLFTPHLGSAVIDVRQEIEARAAENILDALAGRVPRDAVNPGARAAAAVLQGAGVNPGE